MRAMNQQLTLYQCRLLHFLLTTRPLHVRYLRQGCSTLLAATGCAVRARKRGRSVCEISRCAISCRQRRGEVARWGATVSVPVDHSSGQRVAGHIDLASTAGPVGQREPRAVPIAAQPLWVSNGPRRRTCDAAPVMSVVNGRHVPLKLNSRDGPGTESASPRRESVMAMVPQDQDALTIARQP